MVDGQHCGEAGSRVSASPKVSNRLEYEWALFYKLLHGKKGGMILLGFFFSHSKRKRLSASPSPHSQVKLAKSTPASITYVCKYSMLMFFCTWVAAHRY